MLASGLPLAISVERHADWSETGVKARLVPRYIVEVLECGEVSLYCRSEGLIESVLLSNKSFLPPVEIFSNFLSKNSKLNREHKVKAFVENLTKICSSLVSIKKFYPRLMFAAKIFASAFVLIIFFFGLRWF